MSADKHIKITCEISAGNSCAGPRPTIKFDFHPTDGTARYLIKDFAKRANIMKSLVHGTLVIGVAIKLADPTKVKSSDVVFEVGGQRGKYNAEKVARTPLVLFHAHIHLA